MSPDTEVEHAPLILASAAAEPAIKCRICRETLSVGVFDHLAPCACSGADKHVHHMCIAAEMSATAESLYAREYPDACPTCNTPYKFLRKPVEVPAPLHALAFWLFFTVPHRLAGRNIFHVMLLALATAVCFGPGLRGGQTSYLILWVLSMASGKCGCDAVDACVVDRASDFLLLNLLSFLGTVARTACVSLHIAVVAFYISVHATKFVAVQIAFPDAFCAIGIVWFVVKYANRVAKNRQARYIAEVRSQRGGKPHEHITLAVLFQKLYSYSAEDFVRKCGTPHANYGHVSRIVLWWLGFPV